MHTLAQTAFQASQFPSNHPEDWSMELRKEPFTTPNTVYVEVDNLPSDYFDVLHAFSGGIGSLTTGEYTVCVDTNGKVVLSAKSGRQNIPFFNDGVAFVMENLEVEEDSWNGQKRKTKKDVLVLRDAKGNKIKVDPNIQTASPFDHGVSLITYKESPRLRYIDTKGNFVFKNLWGDAVASTYSKNKSVDEKISQYQYYPLCDGLAIFPAKDPEGYKTLYGYRDANGNIVIKPQFSKARDFNDGIAVVCKEEDNREKWGYIDTKGNWVIEPKLKFEPKPFVNGYAVVYNSDRDPLIIDRSGNKVKLPIENPGRIIPFGKSGYYIMKDGSWDSQYNLVDPSFNIVTNCSSIWNSDSERYFCDEGVLIGKWFYPYDYNFYFEGVQGPFVDGLAPVMWRDSDGGSRYNYGYMKPTGEVVIMFKRSDF